MNSCQAYGHIYFGAQKSETTSENAYWYFNTKYFLTNYIIITIWLKSWKIFFDKYFIFIKVFSYPVLNRKPRICAVSDIRTPLYMVHTSLGLSKGHWKLNYWKLRKTCSNELIRTSRLFLYLVPCVWVPSSTTTREGQQNERTESQRVRAEKQRERGDPQVIWSQHYKPPTTAYKIIISLSMTPLAPASQREKEGCADNTESYYPITFFTKFHTFCNET